MPKGYRHTDEAKARIGAAARERKSSAIATAACVAAAAARNALKPKTLPRKVLTPEERRAQNLKRATEWAAAHPEQARANKRRSYEQNRERINAAQREKNKTPERKAFMREYAPKHRAANPEKYRTYSENRRAAEVNAPGAHTDAEWLALVARVGGCAYCGASGASLARDHDVPLARGGSNDISNIVPACGPCNSSKGTLTGDEFRARRRGEGATMDVRWSEQLAAARANSPTHRSLHGRP